MSTADIGSPRSVMFNWENDDGGDVKDEDEHRQVGRENGRAGKGDRREVGDFKSGEHVKGVAFR